MIERWHMNECGSTRLWVGKSVWQNLWKVYSRVSEPFIYLLGLIRQVESYIGGPSNSELQERSPGTPCIKGFSESRPLFSLHELGMLGAVICSVELWSFSQSKVSTPSLEPAGNVGCCRLRNDFL